jgi:hypothetical protein
MLGAGGQYSLFLAKNASFGQNRAYLVTKVEVCSKTPYGQNFDCKVLPQKIFDQI